MDDFYSLNLSLLVKIKPELEQRLEAISLSNELTFAKSKSNNLTVKIANRSIHSNYDPIEEAKQLIAPCVHTDDFTVCCFGFGLAYHIAELLAHPSLKKIYVIEPDIRVLKELLTKKDFSDIFTDSRFEIFVGDDPQLLYDEIIKDKFSFISKHIEIIQLNAYAKKYSSTWNIMQRKIADACREASTNIDLMDKAALRFMENTAVNLPNALTHARASKLYHQFDSVPAIIVSAGPSLDKNISELKEAKDKCLIIATDTALKILLANDICPDIVATLDFNAKSKLHFDGIDYSKLKETYLIYSLEAAPESLMAFKSHKVAALTQTPMARWLRDSLSLDDELIEAGMSVAHFSFNMAESFGADPIVLIGQDLAYTGGHTHAKGTSSRENASQQKDLIKVKSFYDDSILETRNDMYIYKQRFESMVAKTEKKCINATEGGAGIQGCEHIALQEVIEQFCQKDYGVREKLIPLLGMQNKGNDSQIIVSLRRILKRVDDFQIFVRESLDELGLCANLYRESENLDKKLLFRLKEFSKRSKTLNDNRDLLMLISNFLAKNLTLFRPQDEIAKIIVDNKELYTSLNAGLEAIKDTLGQSLKNLEKGYVKQ